MLRLFWYISENYRSVTLEELEDRFHYSRRQLIRIVQNATGKNFKDVIRDMKMERAKMLLRDTTLPVERIAMECGYENAQRRYIPCLCGHSHMDGMRVSCH